MTPFFMAWGMFCAIPCPVKKWDGNKYPQMLLCLPLLGLLLGGIWALAGWALSVLHAPALFAAAVMAVLPYLLTGGIHLDGYMDCADAILSRRDRETRLRILKDSHVGSFAVIAFGILLLLSFSLFASVNLGDGTWQKLIFIPAVCRGCSAWAVLNLKPLSSSGYAAMYGDPVPERHRLMAGLMGLVLLFVPAFLWGLAGLYALMGAAGSLVTVAVCRKNLGGMSGDISGSAITVGEVCAVAALALM